MGNQNNTKFLEYFSQNGTNEAGCSSVSAQSDLNFAEEKIILGEELYAVKPDELSQLSHRSSGAFTFLNINKQRSAGSGVVLSKNLVLTVAHNLYDKDSSLKLSTSQRNEKRLLEYRLKKQAFKFYIGGILGENYYQVQDWRYPPEYRSCNGEAKLRHDYALVKLKNNVQFEQFMEISVPCQVCLKDKGQKLQICGFPLHMGNYVALDVDRNIEGKKIKLVQYGLTREHRIISMSQSQCKIKYAISTLPGQSGSPIVSNDQIIALHNGGSRKADQQFNIGRLVTPDLISNLLNWNQELKGYPMRINQRLCVHQQQEMQIAKVRSQISPQLLNFLDKSTTQETLKIGFDKKLKGIDLSKHTNLKELLIMNNKLKKIDFRHNKQLTKVNIYCNHIGALNVSGNPILAELNAAFNQLLNIDIGPNTILTELVLSNNKLENISLTTNTLLAKLNLSFNNLATIDLRQNINLTQLQLSSNKLTSINIEANTKLSILGLRNNKIAAINLKPHTRLTELYLGMNQLQAIDVSQNIHLNQLYISKNQLKQINLASNIHLGKLDLSGNQIRAIDLSKNVKLSHAQISYNNLQKVVSLFIPQSYLNINNQQAASCELSLIHLQGESRACRMHVDKIEVFNSSGRDRHPNEFGCKYTLRIQTMWR